MVRPSMLPNYPPRVLMLRAELIKAIPRTHFRVASCSRKAVAICEFGRDARFYHAILGRLKRLSHLTVEVQPTQAAKIRGWNKMTDARRHKVINNRCLRQAKLQREFSDPVEPIDPCRLSSSI